MVRDTLLSLMVRNLRTIAILQKDKVSTKYETAKIAGLWDAADALGLDADEMREEARRRVMAMNI